MAKHDTRYGQRSGSGANEPKDHEKKDQRPDWQSRQGGAQTHDEAPTRTDPRDATGDKSRGKATRGADVTANRPHVEGSEQGPS
jgi:hypothetical protein